MLTMKRIALVAFLAFAGACEQTADPGGDAAVGDGAADGADGSDQDAGADGSSDGGSGCLQDDECGEGLVCRAGQCVQQYACESDENCPGSRCGPEGVCVQCLSDADCSGRGYTRCDLERNDCVQCLTSADCSGNSQEPHCEPLRQNCVGCATDAECEPFGMLCDEDESGDPSDMSIPNRDLGGACRECIPGEDEESVCTNGKACAVPLIGEPQVEGMYSCVGAQRGTLATCLRCANSTECAEGSACVSQLYQGTRVANYCAPKAAMGTPCPKTVPTKVSAFFTGTGWGGNYWIVPGDGAGLPPDATVAQFCVPDETISSCVVITEFGDPCTADEEASGTCGSIVADSKQGGICVGPAGEQRCTYECKTNADCATSCVGTDQRYCNPF